jgi:hypothetical protein
MARLPEVVRRGGLATSLINTRPDARRLRGRRDFGISWLLWRSHSVPSERAREFCLTQNLKGARTPAERRDRPARDAAASPPREVGVFLILVELRLLLTARTLE